MTTPDTPINMTASSDGAALAALINPATTAGAARPTSTSPHAFIVCYSPTMITTSGLWQGDNPLVYSLPLFVLQTILIVTVTRLLHSLLSRLRQPRFVAEVLGGIVLGPSIMGKIPNYIDSIFPTRSMAVLETMATLGLVHFIFLVGLQVDLETVRRAGVKAWMVTLAGVTVPFLVELSAFKVMGGDIRRKSYADSYLIFIGVSITITDYPVLARILAELKLLHTETGKVAMSSAILNGGIAWMLLSVAIALSGQHRNISASFSIMGAGVALTIFIYFTIRPAAHWVVAQTEDGQPLDESYVAVMLLGVLALAVVADAVGIHAVFGAFTAGVVIPSGPLVAIMTEKLEDYMTSFLLPLFFAVIGIKFDTRTLEDPGVYGFLIGAILVAAMSRVATIMVVTMFYGVPPREGLTLGILLNTKGIMELIVLHIALDKKVLYTQSYTAMILTSVLMTALVTPVAMLVYRPSRQLVSYKRRTIQRAKPDSELRMLACAHNTSNVPSLISLLEISHPTKRSPIFVCSLHLVELTGRESAMLIVHDHHRLNSHRIHPSASLNSGNRNRIQVQSDHMNKAFESYEQHAGGVSVQPLTVISAYSTMHEDVCNLAEDKHAALIILPFHKQHTVDGGMEVVNPGIRILNQNVIANAPCSVCILVDRGLGGTARIAAGQHVAHHIAVLFIGGPDDREALAYAVRIADHPGISLTILRFVDAQLDDEGMSEAWERERMLDDECVKEFRMRTMSDESVMYTEKVVGNGEEMVEAVRGIDSVHDLYIVGRSEGVQSRLVEGLTDWTDCHELGAIGDLLASSDFTMTVSVLVIQQYKGAPAVATTAVEGMALPESPVAGNPAVHQYMNKANLKEKIFGWGP